MLTLLMVWPLVASFTTATAGWESDNMFCARQFWWVKHALLDRGISPFHDPGSYYPVGYPIAHGEIFAAHTFLFLPITMAWGPIVAYNFTLLFSFAMTGFFTYLWVTRITGSRAAGIVSGVIAAFLPYRFAHLPGHLHMVSTHWFPLTLYAFERFLDGKRTRWAVGLGVATALIALSSWYYAYSAALLLPVYGLVRTRPWREHWTREWWRGIAVAVAVALVLVLPFFIPYYRLMSRAGLERTLGETESWTLNFYDFLLPNALHPVWGWVVATWFPHQAAQWVERGVALGFTAIALAVVAMVMRRSQLEVRAIAAIALVSFFLALGPTLHMGDRPILVPLPRPAVSFLSEITGWFAALDTFRAELLTTRATPIPLPSFFLYVLVPFTRGMRVMARFGSWTGIAIAGLAGVGFAAIVARHRFGEARRRWVVPAAAVVVVALVLLESWSVVGMMPVSPRPVDEWLAKLPQHVVVLELPANQSMRPMQDYYKTVHQRATAMGPVGEGFFPAIRLRRMRVLEGFPSAGAAESIRSWGVTHVLFTPAEIPSWPELRRAVAALPSFTYDRTVGGVDVYRVE